MSARPGTHRPRGTPPDARWGRGLDELRGSFIRALRMVMHPHLEYLPEARETAARASRAQSSPQPASRSRPIRRWWLQACCRSCCRFSWRSPRGQEAVATPPCHRPRRRLNGSARDPASVPRSRSYGRASTDRRTRPRSRFGPVSRRSWRGRTSRVHGACARRAARAASTSPRLHGRGRSRRATAAAACRAR